MNQMTANGLNVGGVGGNNGAQQQQQQQGGVGGMMVNGPGGGPNGATPQQGSANDAELREVAYEAQLNTYIYDYFLKKGQWASARALLKSELKVNSVDKNGPGGQGNRPNGVNDNEDSKDGGLDSKRPNDLPDPAGIDKDSTNSFLFDWFAMFWDMYWAQRPNSRVVGSDAATYMQNTQTQMRLRQQQQMRMLGNPGMMPQNMQGYQNMMRGMQPNGGMPMNQNEPRQRALQNSLRGNLTAQQQMMARNQQQQQAQQLMAQQQMQRGGSGVDMNGQRPQTPSSGENAPSPSKRPRLEGPQFAGQQMMANGQRQGMPGQGMMNANTSADELLMSYNINPTSLTPAQIQNFTNSNPQTQQKSIEVYTQNMRQQQGQQMPRMQQQGSPGMIDPQMGNEYYQNRIGQMNAANMQGNNAGGNHALQDYQMQLMLLEQQNKKRLLMARQEQDNTNGLRPEGQPMPGQPGFAPGASPQGSRSGTSPNPSEQMKRDGSMGPSRGSPGPMNFNQMPPELFQSMKGMEGMANGAAMRPPSSHPQFNGQVNPQQMEAMRAAQVAQASGRMPNGASWQQGPQGQAPMMPQQSPAQQPMGTPQQRNAAMPPPQAVPNPGTNGNRPTSPGQNSASASTPQQTNKPNPKKKEGEKPRKRPTKNKTATAATPSAEADNQTAATPTPSTPITPMHQKSFNENKNGQQAQQPNPNASQQQQQQQVTATTAGPNAAAPNAGVPQPMGDMMQQFSELQDMNSIEGMNFAALESGDVLDQFDFEAYLDNPEADFNIDTALNFDNFPIESVGNDG